MKPIDPFLLGILWVLAVFHPASGQTIVLPTTAPPNAAGVVSEMRPEAIVIQTAFSPLPVSYDYDSHTRYVDDHGTAVEMRTVKPGKPVTIYYVKVGERLIASKIIVRKPADSTPLPGTKEKKTATTTKVD